jgi:hypothetical protein
MDKAPLLIFAGIGLVGYVVWHGHRSGQDCFLCKYRGLAFMAGSLGLGTYLSVSEA